MPNAFIRKLEGYAPLSDDDRGFALKLSAQTVAVERNHELIKAGDKPDHVQLVLEGFAARRKTLQDGNQQIFAYLLPGDFCDLHVAILDAMDHDIFTLSPCKLARISRSAVDEITESRPQLAKALWWCTLVDEATLREWLVNLGQRPADERIAHLFCELHARLSAVGLVDGNSFSLPITQDNLGNTMGLSNVHVNRSLRSLREAELVTFHGKTIDIPDMGKLKAFAEFDPSYLHLKQNSSQSVRHHA